MSLELVFDEIPIELIDPSFFSFCLQTFVAIKIPPDEVVINTTIVRYYGGSSINPIISKEVGHLFSDLFWILKISRF